MDGGLLTSPVQPISTSEQPGILKTAFYITAYNEKSLHQRFLSILQHIMRKAFIRGAFKCQVGLSDVLEDTPTNTQPHTHTRTCTHTHARTHSLRHTDRTTQTHISRQTDTRHVITQTDRYTETQTTGTIYRCNYKHTHTHTHTHNQHCERQLQKSVCQLYTHTYKYC